MNLKRGSVLGGIIFGLALISSVEAQAQGNSGRSGHQIGTTTLSFDYDWGGLSALRTYVQSLIAQIEQSKTKIAQLEAALNSEISARQSGDSALQTAINGISGGGVTQAALDAAIASEAAARAAADTTEAGTRAAADAALEGQIANEAAARAALEASLTSLASLTPLAPLASYMTIDTGTINGVAGPHVILTGANLHIRSGHASGDSFTQNGLGNLIVGYNEVFDPTAPFERAGSHNLVVGPAHRYNFGVGMVVGYGNRLGDLGASIGGGAFNEAGSQFSNISGGRSNRAVGFFSSVGGGEGNTASGNTAVVAAGVSNQATGDLSAVSGGSGNTASAFVATVGGGANETNAVPFTFVP